MKKRKNVKTDEQEKADNAYDGVVSENKELKNQLMRALADYDNLTKRVEKERLVFSEMARVRLISNILPAIDALYGAQEHLKDQGLAIVIQTLEDSLAQSGIMNIKTQIGEKFDEEYHEAVETISDMEIDNGQVTKVILTGWKTQDGSIIRPTKVQVNKLN
ncbi:nucleotide exchange factor GrpE [Candidatus Woesebacteria bacterium]|nr:MAG: nucleotide exchange factor GrpE [Candidatus Woesebacteria bacterium]